MAALVGQNGAGKSTLMHAAVGLLRPARELDHGDIVSEAGAGRLRRSGGRAPGCRTPAPPPAPARPCRGTSRSSRGPAGA
ncbi:ATP-binding cassette domain-containing protein [Nonomuraea diastatica]|uniref:ATP-binding cassette domain-containing protein n=1 Tax=Nonomuraea diastatica TaxID=1848329 RepID=UPI00248263FE|nr:ATP-binding cassette domain-containing protein [Nonomuraea diastatica]